MRGRRSWSAVAFLVALGILVWLAATQSPATTWLVFGAWTVLVVAVIVRAARPTARGHRTRAGMAVGLGGMDEVQGMLLGRPDGGPVTYGSSGPSEVGLVIDRVESDPGDLRLPDHRA